MAEASIIGILTSAGIPPSAAESLGAMILGSPQGNDPVGSDADLDQQRRNAAIDAVMQWLLSFLHPQ